MKYYVNGYLVYSDDSEYQWVDTSKYDVVEKKEAKIERLEQEVKDKTEQMDSCRKSAEKYIRSELNLDKEIKELQKDLSELKG